MVLLCFYLIYGENSSSLSSKMLFSIVSFMFLLEQFVTDDIVYVFKMLYSLNMCVYVYICMCTEREIIMLCNCS